MTPAAFRKLALSLPGAVEAPHFERSSFRIGKKIFATMTKDGQQAMVPVKPLLECFRLIATEPEHFFSFGGWTEKLGALGIHLPKVDAKRIRPLVEAAHARIQPKPKKKKKA